MISYCCDGVGMPHIRRRTVSKWIAAVARRHNRRVGDIAYMFVSEEKILAINQMYLKHDYYTDIITFDYDEMDVINGDIAISIDTVKSNALQLHKPYMQELHRVIIHGILHLCGINDKAPGERQRMQEAEDEALDMLVIIDGR